MTAQPSLQNYGQPPADAKTDGKATTSMILGILSLLLCVFGFLAGIPAVILGHISRSNIRKSMGRLKGDGMALAGLVMGYISIAGIPFMLILAAIAVPNFLRARISANESSAAAATRTIATAQIQYQTAYPDVGYAPDLATLGGGDHCNASTAEHACLIAGPIADQSCTADHWCTKTGYRFMVQADDKRPHESFVATAVPVEPGRSGVKNFCAGADGIIRSEKASPGRAAPYTAEECAALTPLGD